MKEMTDLDVIEPSVSPWSSPIVLVKKKYGSLRSCVYCRQFDNVTKKDSVPEHCVGVKVVGRDNRRWLAPGRLRRSARVTSLPLAALLHSGGGRQGCSRPSEPDQHRHATSGLRGREVRSLASVLARSSLQDGCSMVRRGVEEVSRVDKICADVPARNEGARESSLDHVSAWSTT
ncbi:hypothetical protein PR048_030439 [Dryococelus australis]|uniref:Transposon Ty3-I Gag-Pol polyprotein n=1 Tax=Dryococelus australis TaxID=614101 RepID=A0ABQ9G903_9NEOP|nr:hypothetical protein PR048_030439 [Dryococelus australis]